MSNSPPTAMDVYRVCVAAHSPLVARRRGVSSIPANQTVRRFVGGFWGCFRL